MQQFQPLSTDCAQPLTNNGVILHATLLLVVALGQAGACDHGNHGWSVCVTKVWYDQLQTSPLTDISAHVERGRQRKFGVAFWILEMGPSDRWRSSLFKVVFLGSHGRTNLNRSVEQYFTVNTTTLNSVFLKNAGIAISKISLVTDGKVCDYCLPVACASYNYSFVVWHRR